MADVLTTNIEREFNFDELFFSITDGKGLIRSGNSVFVRVGGYTLDELIGKPHNIVRHPDMPRAVFRLLWDYISEGKPIAAYVKNRAKDGGYYWVLATVTPMTGGYLSIRLKPSSPIFGVVREVYKDLVAFERQMEASQPRKAVIDASLARLNAKLNELGFPDYDSFMHKALSAEIRGRSALVAANPPKAGEARGAIATGAFAMALRDILQSSRGLLAYLDALFANLDVYISLNETLAKKARFVLEMAEDIRVFALNATLLAARLKNAATLEEVAALMRDRAVSMAEIVGGLGRDVDGVVGVLRDLSFQISVAKMQAEMASAFARDLLGEDASAQEDTRVRYDLRDLVGCLDTGLGHVFKSFSHVDGQLRTIGNSVHDLSNDLRALSLLQVTGRVEAARLPEAGDFGHLFEELKNKIVSASNEVAEFSEAVGQGRTAMRGNEVAAIDFMGRMLRRSGALAA